MNRRFQLLLAIPMSGLLAGLLLWATYNAWFFYGDNYRQALSAVVVPAQDWQMLEGQGDIQNSGLELKSPGNRGYALAAGVMRESIDSEQLDHIVVHFSQLGGYQELLVGVAQSGSLSNLHEASLNVSPDLTGILHAHDLFRLDGEIEIATLRVRGAMDPVLVIDRVELHRVKPGFVNLQGLLLRSLIDSGAWTQRSINHNRPNYVPLRVSAVIAAVLFMGLFCFFLLLIGDFARFCSRPWPLVAGLSLVACWTLLDAGWQVSLWFRHIDGVSKYAGVPSDRKALNELDAEIAAFVRKLREKLDDYQPMVIFSDRPFTYFRARYAAVPQPVVGRLELNERWLRRLRPRDVLVTLHLPGVLKEREVSPEQQGTGRKRHHWSLEELAGPGAGLVDCENIACEGSALRLKDYQRPWIVQSPLMEDLAPGIWQAGFNLHGGTQPGWVRLEVLRRGTGDGWQAWAWRQLYLSEKQSRHMTLAFRANELTQYRIRLRELNAKGVGVWGACLAPMGNEGDLVELSLDGDPPYFLARRVLKSEGFSAWEML